MVIPVRAGWRTAASSEPSQTLTSPCPLPICSRFLPQTPPPAPILQISLPFPESGGGQTTRSAFTAPCTLTPPQATASLAPFWILAPSSRPTWQLPHVEAQPLSPTKVITHVLAQALLLRWTAPNPRRPHPKSNLGLVSLFAFLGVEQKFSPMLGKQTLYP